MSALFRYLQGNVRRERDDCQVGLAFAQAGLSHLTDARARVGLHGALVDVDVRHVGRVRGSCGATGRGTGSSVWEIFVRDASLTNATQWQSSQGGIRH